MDKTQLTKKCLECNKKLVKPYKLSQNQWRVKKYCNFECWGKHQSSIMKGKVSPMKGRHHTRETKESLRKSHLNPNGISKIKGYYTFHALKRYARLKGAKGNHSIFQWLELKKKYNHMCLCCKLFEPKVKLTQDHIVPITLGGSDYIENIQPLCMRCNSIKKCNIIDYRNDGQKET